MVDETLVLRKLSELDEYYKQIREYKQITISLYSADWKIQRIVERTLQMMIETCVDLASHIIADQGYRIPKSYADTFKVLHEEKIVSGERLLDPSIVYQVVDMMRGVVDSGTGSAVRRLGFSLPAAGKTGTTNRYMDAWFTGFTPTLCTSVWVGFDRSIGLRDSRKVGITGGRGAVPIWAEFMKKALVNEPSRVFSIPSGIRFENVDPLTGRAATYYTDNPVRVALQNGQSLKKHGIDLNLR